MFSRPQVDKILQTNRSAPRFLVRHSRETLIKFSFSTASRDRVAPDETGDPGDDDRIRAVHKENAAGCFFGRDGAGSTVGRVVRADRAALSESGRRAASGGSGADAADLLFAAVVQLVGPGSGGGAVRFRGHAQLRGH